MIIENDALKSSQTADNVTIPTPAPRKVSPKNHHAPPVPSPQESKYLGNSYKSQNPENNFAIKDGAKTKKPTAPRPPPQPNKSVPDKKGKINIKMSNIESSGTNYSNLEWKK